ncbi:MAG: DUF1641 domain-containing protein [Proteobacteria bacterium]|nr:DUF1641 domain-containing protein [Pseudomonadota bacterium]MBS0270369.1 DUF1641 domain-containing protein [Pseudomonadota bacterium]
MNDTARQVSLEGSARGVSIMDEATERGLAELLEKVAPLLQGRRFHNIVDLLSLASDAVDMADDALIQKMMKTYEEGVGAAWSLGNAARYAANEACVRKTPSLFGLVRAAGGEDVRRGLHFALLFLEVLGRQMRDDPAA